jgi:hypothetical protein
MIQRIQTIYLFISTILLAFLFSNPLAEIVISEKLILLFKFNQILSPSDPDFIPVSTWPVTVLLISTILTGCLAIFQYKNRILQMRLCIFQILLMFGLTGMIYFLTKATVKHMNGQNSVFLWPVILPYISIILSYLAVKRIQKDEKMVRDYDRIR